MKAILKNKFIVIGGSIILIIVILVLLAPVLTSYDYGEVSLKSKQMAPCAEHILGTDLYGRDVWTRILYGGRISLTVAICSTLIALVVGTLLGSICGFVGGAFDFIVSRINDIFMAFPMLLFSLIIGIALGASVTTMFFSIGVPCIPMFFRIARATTMSISERNYVTAAKSMGCRRIGIIIRHIIPNVLPHILVIFSSCMGGAILAESSLGFLGFGIPQPTPSWGLIVNEGKTFMFNYPWTTAFSGLAIALTIFGFNLLGDGLRDHLDQKIRNSSKF
ncbi:MAG: ABC transporter permease [Oscillospiraceae bacterium]|nr:ABC transporter permease [Oscillospiraceae bacterium]